MTPYHQRMHSAFLAYRPLPELNRSKRLSNLDGWDLRRSHGNLLLNVPNAYFYSCFFNYQVPAHRALSAPFYLRQRLGHLNPRRIAAMPWRALAKYTGPSKHGGALHRFPNNVAKLLVEASAKLVEEYKANAANIWPNGSRAREVIDRLLTFKGIKQKRANMTGVLLVTSFGIALKHWNEIDIPVDRHVARVFLRTGLVQRPDGYHRVADVQHDVVQSARTLLPVFPGHLDSAFEIGQTWCTASEAKCDSGWNGQPCPLRASCQRRTNVHIA